VRSANYPKHPATGDFSPATRLRRTRGVLFATLVMEVPLGGAMIIWYEMAVLPHAGQRLAHEGHSRSHAPQTLAC
jgi:hypothetical protein